MVLIEPTDPLKLFDIENLVTLEDGKQVIGFIFELVGPITAPLYSIQLYPEFREKLQLSYKLKMPEAEQNPANEAKFLK